MRRIFVNSKSKTYFVLLFLLALFACQSSAWCVGEERSIEGKIYTLGNEPFVQLAIELDNGQHYILISSHDIEANLRQHQGRRVQLVARGEKMTPEGFAVTVIRLQTLK